MMEKGRGFSWVSECGDGVESGWTYYLNESSYFCSGRSGLSRVTEGGGGKAVNGCYDYDDWDGQSLVSDASSGPPHIDEGWLLRSGMDQEECGNALFWRSRVITGWERHEDSCLQDTASSGKKDSGLSRNEAPGLALHQKEISGRNDPCSCHQRRQSSESASVSKRL